MLDAITTGFTAALGFGYQALRLYSLPLLGVLATIHIYMVWGQSLASGSNLGDALAEALLTLVRIGIFYWGLANLWAMGQASIRTFADWGAAAGGGAFAYTDFLKPSVVWDLGWKVAAPIDDFISRHSGWQLLWNAPDLFLFGLAKMTIVIAFWFASIAVALTVIEFWLAVVCGAVLIPWGVLSATSSLCEFALSWLVGGCIRSLLTALIMAIGKGMLENLPIPLVAGDPTLYGACTIAGAAAFLALMVWQVPKRAAYVAGRGAALGIGGDAVLQTVNSGWRTAMTGMAMTGGAIRGISRLLPIRGTP